MFESLHFHRIEISFFEKGFRLYAFGFPALLIPNGTYGAVRCGYALNSHPAVLDGFIDLVREEQQHSRTQGEKLQPSRPSVRDKLKQELPAYKPAAPKKREPER